MLESFVNKELTEGDLKSTLAANVHRPNGRL